MNGVVCYTAVFSVVTQRSWEERCVTTLKTAVQQTMNGDEESRRIKLNKDDDDEDDYDYDDR